jgi:putative ABC transport system permease protein
VNSLFPDKKYPVIGVVENFHFQSMRQRIQPMVFATFSGRLGGRYLSVKIGTEDIDQSLQYIQDTWEKFAGGQAFEYEFFDDHFKRVYLAEKRTEKIFLVFSTLAIVIACLGLFSLAAFITERRTKEVGIRKVLGASTGGVMWLLVAQFIKWVIIANLIAWPMAWIVMENWLEGFAYRVDIGAGPFILSMFLALFIALLTVGLQAVRAARANPVDSLMYE